MGVSVVDTFKEKTNRMFHEIDGFTAPGIEDSVRGYIQDKIALYDIPVSIVDIAVVGSRCRGLEQAGSDLDVAVEFLTDWREDILFDILHEDDLRVGDVWVDINPITAQRTGTLEQYLPRVEEYLAQQSRADAACI